MGLSKVVASGTHPDPDISMTGKSLSRVSLAVPHASALEGVVCVGCAAAFIPVGVTFAPEPLAGTDAVTVAAGSVVGIIVGTVVAGGGGTLVLVAAGLVGMAVIVAVGLGVTPALATQVPVTPKDTLLKTSVLYVTLTCASPAAIRS